MTLRNKLLVSHVLVTGIVILLHLQLLAIDVSFMVRHLVTASVLVIASIMAVRCLGQQTETVAGLKLIERAIVDGDKPVGNSPFHRCAERIQSHVKRWSSAAAEGRTQTGEIDALLSLFEGDADERQKYGSAAAKRVRYWLSSLGRDANSILRELIACNQKVDEIGKEATARAQQQNESVTIATREVDTLSNDVTALASTTTRAKKSTKETTAHSEATASLVSQITNALKQIRTEINTCEHRVRSMRDHTIEVEDLVRAVNENSAKADMLALNASIESVRAGELGRGFAVAAEEIRKLAKQINASTLAAMEHLRLVDTVVEEASCIMTTNRDALSQQECLLVAAGESLEKMQTLTVGFQDHLDQVDNVSQAQSRRVTAIAKSLDELVNYSDSVRSHVVEGGWKTRSLTELISRLTDVLEPLMVSSSMDPAGLGVASDTAQLQTTESRFLEDETENHENSAAFVS